MIVDGPTTNMTTTPLWTRAFIALTLSAFLLFLNLQMILAAFPAYAKNEFQANDVMVSLITSVFAISAVASRFLTAFLVKHVNRSVILYTGLVLTILISLLYVVAQTIGSLLLMRIGFGLGFGMISTIIPTIVSQIMPANRMGEGIGYFGLSSSIAMSIGPLIGLNIMKGAGFFTLSMLGVAVLISIIPLLIGGKAVVPPVIKKNSTPMVKGSSAGHLKKLLVPALLNILLSITYSGLLGFIALFGDWVHLSQVGLFFLFNVITILMIRPISGKLFDRKGHAIVLIPAACCVIISMLVLSYTTAMPMLIVSALFYGLGFGAIQPTLQAWMLRSSNREQYTVANSMFYNTTDIGIAIGAIILGLIASLTNYAIMYRYAAGVILLFLMLYIVVFSLQKRTKKGLPASE